MILFAHPSSDSSRARRAPILPRRRVLSSSRLPLSSCSTWRGSLSTSTCLLARHRHGRSRSSMRALHPRLSPRQPSPGTPYHRRLSVHTVKCLALISVGKHCKFLLTRLLSRYRVKLVGSNDYRLRAVCSHALLASCPACPSTLILCLIRGAYRHSQKVGRVCSFRAIIISRTNDYDISN